MITSVKETFVGSRSDPNDMWKFWTYMICRLNSGDRSKYNLIRIDNVCENMQRLGCELPLKLCREIIKRHEPNYKLR